MTVEATSLEVARAQIQVKFTPDRADLARVSQV